MPRFIPENTQRTRPVSSPDQLTETPRVRPTVGPAAFARDAGAAVVGAIPDLADSVLASVSNFTPLDFERGTLIKQVPIANQNLGAAEAASGVVGLVASSYIAPEVTALKFFDKAVKGSKVLRAITASDDMVVRALQQVRRVDKAIAEEGLTGKAALKGQIELAGQSLKRTSFVNRARGISAKRTLTQGVATEAMIVALLNENELAVPHDASLATLGVFSALGIALPTAFDQVATGAAVRRALQSEEITRTRALALDAGSTVDDIKKDASTKAIDLARQGEVTPRETPQMRFSGDSTDEAALEAIQLKARRQGDATTDRLANNRLSASDANLSQAVDATSTATNRGINGVPQSGFSLRRGASGEQQTMVDLILNDGVALQGVEEIGMIPKGLSLEDTISTREKFFDQQEISALATLGSTKATVEEKQAAITLLKQVDYGRSLVPTVIDEAEIFPASFYRNRGEPWNGEIVSRQGTGKSPLGAPRTVKQDTILAAPETNIELHGASADIKLPKGKTLQTLDFKESQSLYALGRRFIDTLAEGRSFELNGKPSFVHLDIAETLLREKSLSVDVVFPQGMTREQAQVESFAQKVEMIRKMGDIDESDLLTIRKKLNLPSLSETQRVELGLGATTPAETLALSGLTPAQIRKSSLSDLKKMAANARKKEGTLASVGAEESDLLGNSLKEGFSPYVRSQRLQTAPVLAFRRPMGATILDRAAIENRRAESLAANYATLLNPQTSSDAVSAVAAQLLKDFDSKTVLDLTKLDDTTTVASIGNTRVRRGVFSAQDVAAAGNQTLLAAQRTFRKVSSFFEKDFDRFLETTTSNGSSHRKTLSSILKADNATSRLLVEQFVEARRGFSLTGKTVAAPDGKFEFLLRDTAENRSQYKLVTGRDMPKKATLPLLNGKPLGVDQTALDVLDSFGSIAEKLRQDQNGILRAQGLPPINREPYYIPPEQGKFRAFILDGNNTPIRQIQADSAEQLKRLVAAQRNQKDSFFNKQKGAKIQEEGEIRQQLSLLARAQTDFLDPSIPFVQSIKGSQKTGAGASPFATGRGIQQVLQGFKGISDSNARNLLEVMFQPQLNEARVRATGASLSGKPTREGVNRLTAANPSVANSYVSHLLGRRLIDSGASTVGRIVGPIEGALDIGIREGYSIFTSLGGDKITLRDHRKQFEKAVAELKDRTPFQTANQLLEERGLLQRSPDIAQFTNSMNSLATRLMLRYDTAHAVLNLAGVVTTFPSVALNLLPRSGESFNDVAARLGRTADVFQDVESGKVFTAWSVQKEMAKSLKYMLSPKSHPDWEEAMRFGHLDSSVAEVHSELGRVHDTSTWKVMARKADKIASTISDKSEEMAVAWAYFTSQALLKRIGITDKATRGSLARQMVDQSIANFSPLNRPQIYQSPGVGSALGLFQTYMFNYYSRLFGYVENRQGRLLAVQAAMQAQVFGLNTVPGMTQFNDLVFNASTGQEQPFDGLYERFSQPVADAIFYGVPSTIPLMFGADRQSAPNLSSRGDVDPRIPGSTQLPAGLNAVKTITQGIGRGVQLFRKDNPGVTDQQVGEILQRHVMNRPLSATISMFWTDALVDGSGNKVAEETHTALGTIWRLMGLRTIQQSAEIEGNVKFRGAEALRLERRAKLNRDIKSLIRGNDLNEANLSKAFRTFIQTGGTPGEFVSFLKRSAESSLSTETARALDRQLGNLEKFDSRTSNILRLYNATHDTNVQDPAPQ